MAEPQPAPGSKLPRAPIIAPIPALLILFNQVLLIYIYQHSPFYLVHATQS